MTRSNATLLLANCIVLAQPAEVPPDIRQIQIMAERKAILADASPYWKSMCDLVEAILVDAKRPVFLKNHPRLSDRFSSVDQFAGAVEKWKPRAWALPADINKVDWVRLIVQYLDSRVGESVILVFKERDSDRFLRIKGIFSGNELVDISLLSGTTVKAPVKSIDTGWRERRY